MYPLFVSVWLLQWAHSYLLLVKKVTRLQVAGVVGKYKAGRYKELPDLVRHFRTDRVTIHCDKPTPINLDGELRKAKDVEISVAPCKIRFFHPKDVTVAGLKETEPAID